MVAARDGSAVKSHSTILQWLRRQISLDYYTIPPATQAIQVGTSREVMRERHANGDARARSEERNLPPLAARLARQTGELTRTGSLQVVSHVVQRRTGACLAFHHGGIVPRD